MEGNYAWYYFDRANSVCYWCYSNEMSCTSFANSVSQDMGRSISASDISSASNSKALDKHKDCARRVVHV